MSADFTQLRVYFKMIFHGVKLFDHFAMQNNCPENQLITVGLEGKASKFYQNFFDGIRCASKYIHCMVILFV